jgi:putative addiction module component (TIGR02574 family)
VVAEEFLKFLGWIDAICPWTRFGDDQRAVIASDSLFGLVPVAAPTR